MEGELVDRPSFDGAGEETSAPTYTEIFWKWLPYYMAIGMTYEEFWNCDPKLYKVYRSLDEINRDRKNEYLWLQGMYTYQAILLTAPRLNSIKPTKPMDYPKKPFELHEESKPITVEDKGLAKMKAWMNKVNKKYELTEH